MPSSSINNAVPERLSLRPATCSAYGGQRPVVVVAPARGDADLAACLAALNSQTVAPQRVVAVACAHEQAGPVIGSTHLEILRVPSDLAGATACNAALAAVLPYLADAGTILIANPEVVLPPGFTAVTLGRLAVDPDLGAVLQPGPALAGMFRVRALRCVLTARAAGRLPGPMEVFDPDAADPDRELLLALEHQGWGLEASGGRAPAGRLLAALAGRTKIGVLCRYLRAAAKPALVVAMVLLAVAGLACVVRTLPLAGTPGAPYLWP